MLPFLLRDTGTGSLVTYVYHIVLFGLTPFYQIQLYENPDFRGETAEY
jgi:hypothetical protein